jgi:hypothetical protein
MAETLLRAFYPLQDSRCEKSRLEVPCVEEKARSITRVCFAVVFAP